MQITVIGSHGQIGQIVTRKLAEQGHQVIAMIRDEAQHDEMKALGARPIVADLEGDMSAALEGSKAIVFTAGSGGKTGGDMTLRIDLWGAVRSYRAAARAGVQRYLMVSALKAADPDSGPERIKHYLVAKHIADEYLMKTALDFTILRPGGLKNEPGSGRVKAELLLKDQQGTIPREDVAEALIACLNEPATIGKTFDLVSGETPIAEAVRSL